MIITKAVAVVTHAMSPELSKAFHLNSAPAKKENITTLYRE
jgi:hypothetical protein